MEKLCVINTSFNDRIWDELSESPGASNPDLVYSRVLDYQLKMRVAAAELEWTVYWQDEAKGRANFRVEYEVSSK